MVYIATGSLFLIASMQAAKAEVCAPDLHYMEKKEYESGYHVDYDYPISSVVDGSTTPDKAISMLQESIRIIERDSAFMHQHNADPTGDAWDYVAVVDKEMIRQINCFQNGGKFAKSGADFDANGNYKGSTQQASNKKSKSGKGNNQEQVASAESVGNNSTSTNSNETDAKKSSKRKIYPGSNKCIKIDRDSNNLTAFVENHCSFPIHGEMADEGDCKPDKYGEYYCAIGTPYIAAGKKESVGIIKGKAIFAMCPYPSWPKSKTGSTKTGEKLKVGEKYKCEEL